MNSELEILEELIDSDIFIRTYPTFESYLKQWDQDGGIEAQIVPSEAVFDFYVQKINIKDALHSWFTYNGI